MFVCECLTVMTVLADYFSDAVLKSGTVCLSHSNVYFQDLDLDAKESDLNP